MQEVQTPSIAEPRSIFQMHLRRQRRASRDVAERMTEIRRIHAECQRQVKAKIQLHQAHESAILDVVDVDAAEDLPVPVQGTYPFFRMEDLDEQMTWAKGLSGDTKKMVVAQLEMTKKLGDRRLIAQAPEPSVLSQLTQDFPNFARVLKFIEQRLLLCRLGPSKLCRLPPILLAGPPGVGKTWFAKQLSKSLNGIPYAEADLSQSMPSFAIVGLDAGFDTGRPGLIWKTLQNSCMSPLILFDEIDKVKSDGRHGGLDFLLGLLERSSATRFQDVAMRMAIDVSHVLWFATCNDVSSLDAPILSRFRVFNIDAPAKSQMRRVIESVNRDLLAAADWAEAFDATLADEVIDALTDSTPRQIQQRLEDAYATAAAAQRCHLICMDVTTENGSTKTNSLPMGFVDTNAHRLCGHRLNIKQH